MPMTVFRSGTEGTGAKETSEILAEVKRMREERKDGSYPQNREDGTKIAKTPHSMTGIEPLFAELKEGGHHFFRDAELIGKLFSGYGLTQEAIAARLSVSQSYVANKLRLLRLPRPIREKIVSASLSERHARALLRIRDPEGRARVLDRIIAAKMNVSACEEYVDGLIQKSGEPTRATRHGDFVLPGVDGFCAALFRLCEEAARAGLSVETKELIGGVPTGPAAPRRILLTVSEK